jgi:hypothetical protein
LPASHPDHVVHVELHLDAVQVRHCHDLVGVEHLGQAGVAIVSAEAHDAARRIGGEHHGGVTGPTRPAERDHGIAVNDLLQDGLDFHLGVDPVVIRTEVGTHGSSGAQAGLFGCQ